ncbi:protein serine/threonine phosphatase 2C [Penicillium argentinense]|uniref:Protein serine/threonine phosphatase 2C n=1 Tax=Penicillium argentinense TaxID=1131581 RepID=A0A9W9G5N9_9EURO|nr:protein serine/threonine phosphatase 2C [Penicillium argentinense]KAJ5112482.1 protein serine/threonine phosphatase 2C [Penicillium argentinense]
MLFSRVTRARLGRRIPIPHASRQYSTKGPSSNLRRNVALFGFIGSPGLWWLTTTRDDVPRLECPPTEHLNFTPGPSPSQVTKIISDGAYSFKVKDVAGVNRYDGAQLASNSPCEDRFVHGKLPSPRNDGNEWMTWAVFDGHAGSQTADLLEKQLISFVAHSLKQVESLPGNDPTAQESIQKAITEGFLNLDKEIIDAAIDLPQSKIPFQEKAKMLAPAYAGSCALLSIYDSITSILHVACTGDSRAVLGQQRPDGKWEAIPLSIDQTGYNQDEVSRLQQDHPGEGNMIKDGRVLGLAVSRAFGDSRWKWPLEFQKNMKTDFNGPSPLVPRYDVRTPPYLTAEPVITSTKIDPSRPSFLIMASDGLWDMLSNEQAVNLVGKWLESSDKRGVELEPTYEPFDFGQFWKGINWKFVEERTTVQDDNAAVHLVRNSLGGNHHELIAGRLSFSAPFSRHIRDDITVQVAFLNVPGL